MNKLEVYLTFPGTCREALNFYKDVFGGEILSMQTFGEAPMESSEDQKDRIMHAQFKSDEIYFMASDGMGESCSDNNGTQVSLSIDSSDEGEQEKIFNKLSEGGNITMPLQDTFWGAKFGMLVDKFGINWMFNCSKAPGK